MSRECNNKKPAKKWRSKKWRSSSFEIPLKSLVFPLRATEYKTSLSSATSPTHVDLCFILALFTAHFILVFVFFTLKSHYQCIGNNYVLIINFFYTHGAKNISSFWLTIIVYHNCGSLTNMSTPQPQPPKKWVVKQVNIIFFINFIYMVIFFLV